jgi:phage gpG-like protein
MFGIDAKIVKEFRRVESAAKRAQFESLRHAAASIRIDVQQSIEKSSESSSPGDPPHSRRGQLKRSIVFDAGPDEAIVGPRFSVMGESAGAHEFGGEYKGEDYPERPFMLPALERNQDRFASSWSGSIGT